MRRSEVGFLLSHRKRAQNVQRGGRQVNQHALAVRADRDARYSRWSTSLIRVAKAVIGQTEGVDRSRVQHQVRIRWDIDLYLRG